MKFLLIGFIFMIFSCSSKKDQQDEGSNISKEILSPNDPRVVRAFALAQDSLPFFIETFNKLHEQKEYNFFVKTKLSKGNDSEQIWVKPFMIVDKEFSCILDSNPRSIASYRFGDTLQVNFRGIEDFMIILGDSVIGNYLQRELQRSSVQ